MTKELLQREKDARSAFTRCRFIPTRPRARDPFQESCNYLTQGEAVEELGVGHECVGPVHDLLLHEGRRRVGPPERQDAREQAELEQPQHAALAGRVAVGHRDGLGEAFEADVRAVGPEREGEKDVGGRLPRPVGQREEHVEGGAQPERDEVGHEQQLLQPAEAPEEEEEVGELAVDRPLEAVVAQLVHRAEGHRGHAGLHRVERRLEVPVGQAVLVVDVGQDQHDDEPGTDVPDTGEEPADERAARQGAHPDGEHGGLGPG